MLSSRPPYPIFPVLDIKKTMSYMVLKPENGCFRAAPPKKWAFFAQKRPKNAKIGPKTLFFWAWDVSSRPPNPVLPVLELKK